jgi:omega-hydroxy-beta-dihydromenaquinone-9 sulfotransferase
LFSIAEKAKYGKKIRDAAVHDDPVFIIGHWRSGSTFLHQLMSLDPNFRAPTLFQVAIPDSFLTSHFYYKPIMNLMVNKFRPMDKVRLGMDEPQEDEYAVYRITQFSPLERLVFPKKHDYFLLDFNEFLPDNDSLGEWEQNFMWFFKKLSLKSGKPVVSKNPFNSLRIRELHKLFPRARFIHIYRHPFDVIPSTIHMWNIVQQQNALNHLERKPELGDVVTVFDRILSAIQKDKESLPENSFYELRFESLESDPVAEIINLYKALNLNYSSEFEVKMKSFISVLKGFQKNIFHLTTEEKVLISQRLRHHMEYYGYSPNFIRPIQ